MTHIKALRDDDGTFTDWQPCLGGRRPCRQCRSLRVRVRLWESHDGAYEDEQYVCDDCGATWWVDGIDA